MTEGAIRRFWVTIRRHSVLNAHPAALQCDSKQQTLLEILTTIDSEKLGLPLQLLLGGAKLSTIGICAALLILLNRLSERGTRLYRKRNANISGRRK
ncbi:hypothetical protein PoB_005228900 [Plakobranchus ocellatus]|uniref:Uncharacterized protein n=1 Tax=Plakobranchus ocellatus TaxID=259542 RepID=A0AAV4C508_9GAST|nr:hypothetical protein PoB_005228900 [Plakobranchus ocellatus]